MTTVNQSRFVNTFIWVALLLLSSISLVAQQAGIPYQAYIIDTNAGYVLGEQIKDVPLANSNVLLHFEIRNENGQVEYIEHIEVETDAYGLASTIVGVGNGTPQAGTQFSDIDWNGKKKTLNIDIDFSNSGNNFVDQGEMPIIYIPGPAESAVVGLSTGTGAPTATQPASPNAGDVYVDQTTGAMYSFNGTTWVAAGSGSGKGVTTGSGAPTATQPASPNAGDVYVDETTGILYAHNGTTWVAAGSGSGKGVTTGSGAPHSSNPLDPDAGDLYVDHTTGYIYTYNGTTNEWESQRQTTTTLALVTNDNGTPADPSDDFDQLVYTNENNDKNSIDIATLVQAQNGLTVVDGAVELGGTLTKPTTITTSATNTLTINGLQEETAFDVDTDEVLIIDQPSGVIKRTSVAGLMAVEQKESLVVATNDGDRDFDTPLKITNAQKINVYRNGARVSFTTVDDDTIRLESEASCYKGDEIRIVQLK